MADVSHKDKEVLNNGILGQSVILNPSFHLVKSMQYYNILNVNVLITMSSITVLQAIMCNRINSKKYIITANIVKIILKLNTSTNNPSRHLGSHK